MNSLEKITVVVGKQSYDLDYVEQLKCAEETINENLRQQPSLFAWYAVLYEMASSDVDTAKFNLELTEASLDKKIRSENEKLTEAKISAAIKLEPESISAREAYLDAKKNEGVLRAIRDAFYQRKDCVISLASNMRAQADPEIYLKKEAFKG